MSARVFRPDMLVPLPLKVPGKHRWVVGAIHVLPPGFDPLDMARVPVMSVDNLCHVGIACYDCEGNPEEVVNEPCMAMVPGEAL